MFLYNITVIIEDSIEHQFLQWINNLYIRNLTETGLVVSSRLLRVLNSPNEGLTFCLQLVIESSEDFNRYQTLYEPLFINELADLFTNKYVFFNTLMEYITYE